MSPQNIYDDPGVFAGYTKIPRSVEGLEAVYEWPAFQRLLPGSLEGLRILDLGCGLGYFAREARRRGARSVLGVDLSERMLADARAHGEGCRDQLCAGLAGGVRTGGGQLRPGRVDAGAALRQRLCRPAAAHRRLAGARAGAWRFRSSTRCLPRTRAPTGTAARTGQCCTGRWTGTATKGERRTRWFVDGVVKYHRTVETYVNRLLESGVHAGPRWRNRKRKAAALLAKRPAWHEERRRPPFLLVGADRTG